jgi:hypothetical protein
MTSTRQGFQSPNSLILDKSAVDDPNATVAQCSDVRIMCRNYQPCAFIAHRVEHCGHDLSACGTIKLAGGLISQDEWLRRAQRASNIQAL